MQQKSEKKLKMYDKARLLRVKDKQVIVKQTDISVNLNELLKQVKQGGIVAIYRCPHYNGTLKVNDKKSLESLKNCEHCGSEIDSRISGFSQNRIVIASD